MIPLPFLTIIFLIVKSTAVLCIGNIIIGSSSVPLCYSKQATFTFAKTLTRFAKFKHFPGIGKHCCLNYCRGEMLGQLGAAVSHGHIIKSFSGLCIGGHSKPF